MSLSIIQEPLILQPVNNPVPIVISSDNAADIGYRYFLTLNITGTSTSSVSLFIYPDTTHSNYMVYDASMILSDFIGSDNNWDASGITFSNEDVLDFSFSITEFILMVSGDTYSSGIFKAFRGVKQYGDFWDFNKYLCGSSSNETNKFLSNWGGNRNYKITEYGTINTFYGIFSAVTYEALWDKYMITSYTTGGTKNLIFSSTGLTNTGVVTLPLGPANLNLYSPGFIDRNTNYYDVRLDYSNTIASETLRVNIDKEYYRHSGIEFLWLGELGNYETFSFRMIDVKSIKIDTNESRKNYFDFNSTYQYSIGDRGRKTINVKSLEKHTCYSDWITTQISENLMELYSSPEVFIIKDNHIYPIIIETSEIEVKTELNNHLFNHRIDFTMAYEKLSNI